MAQRTYIHIDNTKTIQISGETMSYSGTNEFHGTVDFISAVSLESTSTLTSLSGSSITLNSGATLTILENRGVGKVLTSDANGNATWEEIPTSGVCGLPENLVMIDNTGCGLTDSGINAYLVYAGL